MQNLFGYNAFYPYFYFLEYNALDLYQEEEFNG